MNIVDWLRFGKVSSQVVSTVGHGVVSEVEYKNKKGDIIGYWAYGYYDPKLPFPTFKSFRKHNKFK